MSLYESLEIVIDAANGDLAEGTMTQVEYDAKMKSTLTKMNLFLKKKMITQDQYNALNEKMNKQQLVAAVMAATLFCICSTYN